jgi:uncharacterized protein with von Willebrand factor type A (vWA) domain
MGSKEYKDFAPHAESCRRLDAAASFQYRALGQAPQSGELSGSVTPQSRRWARDMPGKRIQIEDDNWAALRLLASDRMMTFQELADEAFADLLKKHGRPVDLRAALRKSAGTSAEVVPLRRKTKPRHKK